MHLQTIDPKEPRHRYKLWLEEKGKRVIQPAGKIPANVLKEVRSRVSEYRQWIEDKWVRFMMDNGWLELHVALPHVSLVAYPHTPNKFVRKLDFASWFTQDQLKTLKPEGVVLDREMASLRLWADRPDDLVPYDLRLSTILWQG